MSNHSRLLDQAFQHALKEAAKQDKLGVSQYSPDEFFGEQLPTHEAMVRECIEFYNQQHKIIDDTVQTVARFLNSPFGVSDIKALEASLDNEGSNPLSLDLATRLLNNGGLGLKYYTNVVASGIGVSAGASFFAGPLAGADIVFDHQDITSVFTRTWVGGSVKSGISANAGLELSYWYTRPFTGPIMGWLIDLYLPTAFIILPFFRFMYIKQRQEEAQKFTFSGYSLQFPLGIGLPLRRKKEKHATLVAPFAARQKAVHKTKPSTLTVINKATTKNTIAVNENATLTVNLYNPSQFDIFLNGGDIMTIGMPFYFTTGEDSDVSKMSINFQDWEFSLDEDETNLILTVPSEGYKWGARSSIVFDINNVESSNSPVLGQASSPGYVTLKVTNDPVLLPIVNTAQFDLDWGSSGASVNFITDQSYSNFTINAPANGNDVNAYAQPGNIVIPLTTATAPPDSPGGPPVTWSVGYIFNYDSDNNPQICAAIYKQGAPAIANKTLFTGLWLSPSDTSHNQSTAYYDNSASKPYIQITVTFDSEVVKSYKPSKTKQLAYAY